MTTSVGGIYSSILFFSLPPLSSPREHKEARKEGRKHRNDLAFWQANLPCLVPTAGLLSMEDKQTVESFPWNFWVKTANKALSFRNGIFTQLCVSLREGIIRSWHYLSQSQTFFPGSGPYRPSVLVAIPTPCLYPKYSVLTSFTQNHRIVFWDIFQTLIML